MSVFGKKTVDRCLSVWHVEISGRECPGGGTKMAKSKKKYDPKWTVGISEKLLRRICKVLDLDPRDFFVGQPLDDERLYGSEQVLEFIIQSAEMLLAAIEGKARKAVRK
jgi:hypothetical protein